MGNKRSGNNNDGLHGGNNNRGGHLGDRNPAGGGQGRKLKNQASIDAIGRAFQRAKAERKAGREG